MSDLQRNLLEFMSGVQVDSDGEVYTVKGRIKLGEIRKVIADKFPDVSTPVIIYDDDKPDEPKTAKKVIRSGGR